MIIFGIEIKRAKTSLESGLEESDWGKEFNGENGRGYQPITEGVARQGNNTINNTTPNKPPPPARVRPAPHVDEIVVRARDATIGQECICPDGLGRVSEVIPGVCDSYQIKVNTYEHNRGCNWAEHNVKMRPLK